MKNITIGVIGAGLIGRKHLRKLAERSDYDLVGIADVNVDPVKPSIRRRVCLRITVSCSTRHGRKP
jgi:predicted dehydrogenase